jgi:hypothetical protein
MPKMLEPHRNPGAWAQAVQGEFFGNGAGGTEQQIWHAVPCPIAVGAISR